VTLTVAINNGNVIEVIEGENCQANAFFSYTDEDYMTHWPTRYMAVMTGWGSDGYW